MKIAFVGKGGSGKSTISELFVRHLVDTNQKKWRSTPTSTNTSLQYSVPSSTLAKLYHSIATSDLSALI